MSQDKGNGVAQESVQLGIKIQLTSDGKVLVTGPIQNKILMLGMLECAKDIVNRQKAEQPLIAPAVIVPRFGN